MIAELSQSPTPVPFIALVVKNASKILSRFSFAMPIPRPEIVTRAPAIQSSSVVVREILILISLPAKGALAARETRECKHHCFFAI